jgi:CheY-like chemotaxis protein
VRAISAETHARVVAERDNLQRVNADLQFDMDNLHCDLDAVMRERDALRQAWATVRAELSGVEQELARLRQDLTPGLQQIVAEAQEASPVAAPPTEAAAPVEALDPHRYLAELLATAPGVIENLRRDLKLLSASPLDELSRGESTLHAKALVDCTRGIHGHPIQRLAIGINSLLGDITAGPETFAVTALATLKEALNGVSALLSPDAFRQASNVPRPRVLAVANDQDLLATLVAALEIADIQTVAQPEPGRAAAQLRATEFDLVFIDNDLPGVDGLDLCSEIRGLPGYSRTPILFLTAASKDDGRAQSFLAGGSDFLCKPFNILELTLKTETWIYRKRFGLLPRGAGAGNSEVPSIEIGLEALRQLP